MAVHRFAALVALVVLASACSSAATVSDASSTPGSTSSESEVQADFASPDAPVAPTTTGELTESTKTLDQANEAYIFNMASLDHDGERFIVGVGLNIDPESRVAAFTSTDGTEWETIPSADPTFDPQPLNASVNRIGDLEVFLPVAQFEDFDQVTYVSKDLMTWDPVPFTEPEGTLETTLRWYHSTQAWPDSNAFVLVSRPTILDDQIDFQGVRFSCVAPCQDRYVSLEDDQVVIFETDLDSTFERFFFVTDTGDLEEVAGPPFSTGYLLETSSGPLAIEPKILGEHRAAHLVAGEWVPTNFEPPPGNLFMMRSHGGRIYAFSLQLGDIFELFISEDDAATWQSVAEFDQDEISGFGPVTAFTGGPEQQVAMALGGEPSKILYAADGMNFETLVEVPWEGQPFGVHDLAFSETRLGYVFGSPIVAGFIDLP